MNDHAFSPFQLGMYLRPSQGTFVEGKRTGIGRVFNVKDKHLVISARVSA